MFHHLLVDGRMDLSKYLDEGDAMSPARSRAGSGPVILTGRQARTAGNVWRVPQQAFPVILARRVGVTAAFYEWLGFQRQFQLPAEGEPGYVGLRRGTSEVACG
jgi:hypothetical protein